MLCQSSMSQFCSYCNNTYIGVAAVHTKSKKKKYAMWNVVWISEWVSEITKTSVYSQIELYTFWTVTGSAAAFFNIITTHSKHQCLLQSFRILNSKHEIHWQEEAQCHQDVLNWPCEHNMVIQYMMTLPAASGIIFGVEMLGVLVSWPWGRGQ